MKGDTLVYEYDELTKLKLILLAAIVVVVMTSLKLVLHHPYSRGFTHTVVMADKWQQA